jgi:putative colanic acid biosynthesis acetyltransferase WcaF
MKLDEFKSELSFANKVIRLVWGIVWFLLFLPTPRPFHAWRCFLLRLFGASVGKGVRIYGTAKVYFPPNLTLEAQSIVGPHVDIYCLAPVTIGENSMVSQYSYLCAASHDYTLSNLPLIPAPISIGNQSWVCARAFIGPGVKVGSNCVVGACAVVVKDVQGNQVVGGNPAKFIKAVERRSSE